MDFSIIFFKERFVDNLQSKLPCVERTHKVADGLSAIVIGTIEWQKDLRLLVKMKTKTLIVLYYRN